MMDWATEQTIYQTEWFGLYCAVVFILILVAWEVVVFIDKNLKP